MMSKALVKTVAGGAALNCQQGSLTQQQEVAEGKEMEGVKGKGRSLCPDSPIFCLSAHKRQQDSQEDIALAKLELMAACKHVPAAQQQLCASPADQTGSVCGTLLLVPFYSSHHFCFHNF